MITEKQYKSARKIFAELCKVLDGQRSKWLAQFGRDMPDDYIPLETFAAIDDCFAIMVRYQRQQEKVR